MHESALSSFQLQDGQLLHFLRRSESSGIPVILLHGLSQQANYWDLVVRESDFDFVALDQRCHGYSQQFTEDSDVSVERIADDVVELLDQLDISRAHVVGHSWGASVALSFARRYSARAASCTMIDGGAFNPRDLIPEVVPDRETLLTLLTPPEGPFPSEMLNQHYRVLNDQDGDAIMGAVDRTYRRIGHDTYESVIGLSRHMEVLQGLIDFDHVADIQSLSVPSWVVLCESHDEWQSAKSSGMPLLLNNPNIHVQRWYGCTHDVPLQDPKKVAGLISYVVGAAND